MTFIAIVTTPDGYILPIVNGGDGPDAECMATYANADEAERAMNNTMAAKAWGYDIIDLDNLS